MRDANYPDLAGASVFITGGGSGIGAALTRGFARQGARVAFADRCEASGLAEEVARDTGAEVLYLACDVTDIPALEAAMDRAARAHGPIRILVNNAADDTRMASLDVTEEMWEASQAVNLKAYFFACRKAAQGMGEGGAIVNYSSISYMMGAAGYAPYIAANAAITGLTRSLAREWGEQGIRVNAIAPGWVLTERQRRLWMTPDSLRAHVARQCLKVEIGPEDLVGPTLFLASRESRMVTGQVLVVDAGVVVTG